MNNYKIIEDRPELTSSQVVAGMNFAAIQAGALALSAGAVGGKALAAGLITKGFFAVLAVTAGLAVYKSYESSKEDTSAYTMVRGEEDVIHRDKSKGPLLIMETIPAKQNKEPELKPNLVCQSKHEQDSNGTAFNRPRVPLVNIDSLNKLEEAPLSGTKTPEPKTEMLTVASAKRLLDDFKPSPNAECFIWRPASFCDPTSPITSQIGLDCDRTEFDYLPCASLDGMGYCGVWLKITSKGNTAKFRLESYLKNITLVREVENQCIAMYPIAISVGGYSSKDRKGTYISDKFKTVKTTVRFSKYVDVYIIFKDVRPGDKLIIENFIMAKVAEGNN